MVFDYKNVHVSLVLFSGILIKIIIKNKLLMEYETQILKCIWYQHEMNHNITFNSQLLPFNSDFMRTWLVDWQNKSLVNINSKFKRIFNLGAARVAPLGIIFSKVKDNRKGKVQLSARCSGLWCHCLFRNSPKCVSKAVQDLRHLKMN